MAPGVVLGYYRNVVTNQLLAQAGIQVIPLAVSGRPQNQMRTLKGPPARAQAD